MWTMTKIGFYSVVQHRADPNDVLIRARSKQDLENLLDFARKTLASVGGLNDEVGAIEATIARADYPFRLSCTKVAWATLMGAMIGDIDYDNFKTRIGKSSPARAHTYGLVWQDLHRIEREPKAGVYATAAKR